MEKLLRKSALYGFLVGIGYAILFTRFNETNLVDGVAITTYSPIMEYIINVLQSGVVGAIIALLGSWLIGKRTKTKDEENVKTYYVEVFLGIFIVTLIIGTIIGIITSIM